MLSAGLLALGHFHGVNTGGKNDPNDLEVAQDLMLTCYEMYRRVPAGLSPEIVFFIQHDQGDDYPKQHHMDVGGGDFVVKPQVRGFKAETLRSRGQQPETLVAVRL